MKLNFAAPSAGLTLITLMMLTGCQTGPDPAAPANALIGGSGRPAAAIPSLTVTQSLDDVDQAAMVQHFNKTMESTPTGQPSGWTNPSSGSMVQLSPTRTYQQPNGTYCRDFTQTVTVKDKPQTTKGSACRTSDGAWQIVG